MLQFRQGVHCPENRQIYFEVSRDEGHCANDRDLSRVSRTLKCEFFPKKNRLSTMTALLSGWHALIVHWPMLQLFSSWKKRAWATTDATVLSQFEALPFEARPCFFRKRKTQEKTHFSACFLFASHRDFVFSSLLFCVWEPPEKEAGHRYTGMRFNPNARYSLLIYDSC